MQQADAEGPARGAGGAQAAHPDQRRLVVQALHAAVADLQHRHLLHA